MINASVKIRTADGITQFGLDIYMVQYKTNLFSRHQESNSVLEKFSQIPAAFLYENVQIFFFLNSTCTSWGFSRSVGL